MQPTDAATASAPATLERPSVAIRVAQRSSAPAAEFRWHVAATPAQVPLRRPLGATRELFWVYLGAFIVLHLLLPLACIPWLFSWTGVGLVFVGNYVFGSLGINLAYHRILTHQV